MSLLPAGSVGRDGRRRPGDVDVPRGRVWAVRQHARALLPAAARWYTRATSIDPARPWFGIGPLGWATLDGASLHAALEDALADEAGGTRGHVLPVPAGPAGDDPDADPDDPHADLRRDIAALRGATVLTETTSRRVGRRHGRGAARGLETAADRRRTAGTARHAPDR